jgi:hypothetical protein
MPQPNEFLKFRGALYRRALQMVQSPGTGEPNRKPHQRPLVPPPGKDPSGRMSTPFCRCCSAFPMLKQ